MSDSSILYGYDAVRAERKKESDLVRSMNQKQPIILPKKIKTKKHTKDTVNPNILGSVIVYYVAYKAIDTSITGIWTLFRNGDVMATVVMMLVLVNIAMIVFIVYYFFDK